MWSEPDGSCFTCKRVQDTDESSRLTLRDRASAALKFPGSAHLILATSHMLSHHEQEALHCLLVQGEVGEGRSQDGEGACNTNSPSAQGPQHSQRGGGGHVPGCVFEKHALKCTCESACVRVHV